MSRTTALSPQPISVGSVMRRMLAATAAVAIASSVVLPVAYDPIEASSHGAKMTLEKDMPERTLYGDTTEVTLTAQNVGIVDAYNASFRDVLPRNTMLDPATPAEPAPTTVLPQADGTTVLIWENVADALMDAEVSITYTFKHVSSATSIGTRLTNAASVYVSENPRLVPDFHPETGVADGDFDASAATSAVTELVPFLLTKTEKSEEAELLRGVHEHQTVYTLEVQNNYVLPTSDIQLDDWLPDGLEFLGCGTVDNTTIDPVTLLPAEEYPGSGSIVQATPPTTTNCAVPSLVETVATPPAGADPAASDVYTHVRWVSADLGAKTAGPTLAAGQLLTLEYVAAIPLRRNEMFADPAPVTTGVQTANLDNNTGSLTSDEESLINYALATGTTGGTTYTDDDDTEVIAEDVSIHKSVDDELEQTAITTWTLKVETSEYTTNSGPIRVTDTVPDGLSVTGGDYTSTPVEHPNGTWTVVWDLAAGTFSTPTDDLTLTTTTDAEYSDGGPVASRDSVTNTVELMASNATIIKDNDGSTMVVDEVPDASSATIEAKGITIAKTVGTPASTGNPADCTGAIVWEELGQTFTPGDTVCWRVELRFPELTDTLEVTIKDFLPAGYLYVDHTYPTGTEGHTLGDPVTFSDNDDYQQWTYDIVDAGSQRFVAIIETTMDEPNAVADGDITANLAKASFRNTNRELFQLRDDANAEVAEPQMELLKQIVDVDDQTVGPWPDFPRDWADVIAGQVVSFEVVITNTGSRDALDVEVWDVLPWWLQCDTVSVISAPGVCDHSPPAQDRIIWDGLTVPANSSTTLSYDVTIPSFVGPDRWYVNVAGVRQYEADTNEGDRQVYVPADNIDPTQTPNTTPANDDAGLSTPVTTFDKTLTTSVDDAAAGNENDDATIGETATYEITAMIPAGTTVDGPVVVSDTVPAGLTIVGTPSYTVDTGTGPGTPIPVTPSGQTVEFEIAPALTSYRNDGGSGDDVFVLTIETTVDDAPDVTRGTTLVNAASFTYGVSGETIVKEDAETLTIVEPQLSVSKDENDDDDVVYANDPITYTLKVSNGTGDAQSSAYGSKIVDTVPTQIVPQGGLGDAIDGERLPGDGLWNLGARTITWEVDEIKPGDELTLTYDARVTGPVTTGAPITNTVVVTASSLPGDVTGERDPDSPNGGEGSGYIATATDTVMPPAMTIEKAASVPSASIGEPVTATLTVTIPAQVVVHDATVLDMLPSNVTYVRTSRTSCVEAGVPGSCSPSIAPISLGVNAAGVAGWFLGDLTPPANGERVVTIEYLYTVDDSASAGNTLVNTATLYGNADETITGTPTSVPTPDDFTVHEGPVTATVLVTEPSVTIDKSVTPTVADAGEVLVYEIKVTNATGPNVSTAFDVRVTDDVDDPQLAAVTTATTGLPAGVTLVGGSAAPPYVWTIDELAPGESITFAYTAELDPSALLADDDTVVNTATVESYTSFDTDNPPDDAGDPVTYGPVDDTVTVDLRFPSVTYDKAVGPQGDEAVVGTPFEWVITIDNTGDGAALAVDVTDTLPEGWTYNQDAVVSVDGGAGFAPPAESIGTADPTVITWSDVVTSLAADSSLTITFTATPELAAQAANGTGLSSPHTNQVVAIVEDPSGAPGNGSGPYATNAQDPGATTPATAAAFLPAPGTIGDTVWVDLDGDGVRDAGWETDFGGISDVTVTLTGTNGVVMTVETDDDGIYLFEDVPPGDYTVTVASGDVDFPTGVTPTIDGDGTDTPHVSKLTLASGGEDLDQDFGYVGAGTVGDTVFYDLDADGSQGPLEPGLPGLTVELFDADGNLVATDVTDDVGFYEFVNLPHGDWTVVVTRPDAWTQTGDPDGTLDDQSTATLDAATPSTDLIDFGYSGDLALGDTVWIDTDGDGVQDAGWETDFGGISDVTVSLLNEAGTLIATTDTDADGVYGFANLMPGVYSVVVDVADADFPAGVSPTFDDDGIALTPHVSTTTLTTDDDLDQDFGYNGAGSLGDTVWLDIDKDGVQGPDELGLVGLTVTLKDAAGNVVATDVTDENGEYGFTNLAPGDWTVEVGAPAGYDPTYDLDGIGTASTATVTLGVAESRDDVDFGYAGPGSVGDTVFYDVDGDGTQNGLEPGLPGLTVTLFDGAGREIATDVTGPDGGYLFENLPLDAWTVVVTPPADATQTGDPDATLDDSGTVVLTVATPSDLDQDFGYGGSLAIGDTVWIDLDGDGVRDANWETTGGGLAGVTVTLKDAGGVAIATTTTGPTGLYGFENLLPGDYTVELSDLPDGLTQTFDADGTDTADTSSVTLDATNLDQDFGYRGAGTVGDTVFYDLNADGVQNGLEPGLPGLIVELFDADSNLVGVRVTNPDGFYEFGNLPHGDWTVVVTRPDAWTQTGDPDGTLDDQSTATLDAATPSTDLIDFGYAGDLAVGDTVWLDRDGDGVQDAGWETDFGGIADVTVSLLNEAGTAIATTETDADGVYGFANLMPGVYSVVVDDADADFPAGVSPTADADGTDVTPHVSTTTLTTADDLDQDFGYNGADSLGDTVWLDLDKDGVQGPDELGLVGLTVTLKDAAGNVVATDVTDDQGEYLFENLEPGEWTVEVDAPAGYDPTYDVDGIGTASTATVTLPINESRDDVDFGYAGPGSVGDTVFYDVNGDGIQNGLEPGLPGLTVTLLDGAGREIATDVTGPDGGYLFENLPLDAWTVVVTPPADATQTGDPDATLDDSGTVVLTVATPSDLDQDFGYGGSLAIGDTVWIDLDGDGVRDPGWESVGGGLEGVTVTLRDADGVAIATTTTGGTGRYGFMNLLPGDYTVELSGLPDGLTATFDADGTDTADTSSVTLDATNLDQDFGYRGVGTVGDTVFYDLDADGAQGPLEPGLPGLIVELFDADGNLVATDLTGAAGDYLFENLPHGEWTVVVSAPDGAVQTFDPDGTLDDASTATLDAVTPSTDLIDFGYTGSLTIGDVVWYDLNANGVRDAGWEVTSGGLDGATVSLLDADGTLIATTTTSAGGVYGFDNLLPGTYTVVVDEATLGAALVQTFDADGLLSGDRSTTTLVDAEDLEQDFGYRGTGSIGDTVWLDLDADGVLDADEVGVPGLTVTLKDADGNVVATTETNADGEYIFENLPPGEWTVEVTPSDGYDPTYDVDGTDTPDVATITLADGETRDDVDFGYAGTGSIGDEVWVDLDKSGTRETGEPGIPGVVISLVLDGRVVATTTTGTDGLYLFENLPPGDYDVLVDAGSLPVGFDPTNDPDADGIDNESSVTLGDGDDVLDQDFGYFGPGMLGDRVWLDRDRDGVQDIDEPGIAGVTVQVLDGAGTVMDTRVTDADGRYIFEGLFAGPYTVVVVNTTLPAVTQTYDSDGTATPHRSATTLDTVDLMQDFGYVGPFVLGDTVFLDLDEDGLQGPLEPGIEGVTMTLVDVATGLITGVAITDADGRYLFENLDARAWRVEADTSSLPSTMTQTVDADGLDTPNASETTLTDAHDLDQDFGYVSDGVLGDRVFFDRDADGIDDGQDRDPGLPGVTVELYDGDGDLIAVTTTDDEGLYLFENLPGGVYTIVVVDTSLPLGLRPSGDADGVATPNASTTTLAPGGDDRTQDFAYTGTSSIGDQVWFDDDVDGTRSMTEGAVRDVVVRLYTADDLVVPYATTTTDLDGLYVFENLRPGDYVVEFVAPDGSVITPAVDVGDDATDSDASPADGRSGTITLAPNEVDVTVDAGVVRLGAIGDLVFEDLDADGLQSPGETGVEGISVRLELADAAGTEVARTTTDADGAYLFDGLMPGDYIVVFDVGDELDLTLATVGDDTSVDSDPDPATGRSGIVSLAAGQTDDSVDAGVLRTEVLGEELETEDPAPTVEPEDLAATGVTGLPWLTVLMLSSFALGALLLRSRRRESVLSRG